MAEQAARKISREFLAQWEHNDDVYLEDDVHAYFDEVFTDTDWCDIAEEGRQLYNLLFGENIEKGSPIDSVITGVSAAASEGAYSEIAAVLGFSGSALRLAVEIEWQFPEGCTSLQKAEMLIKEIEEREKWISDLKSGALDYDQK